MVDDWLGPRCRHQYCWLCFVDYREVRRDGNSSHRGDCLYHSNNLPPAPEGPVQLE